MTQREEFELHWFLVRGKKQAMRELVRRLDQPDVYIQDSANRHWVTWQAAQAVKKNPGKLQVTLQDHPADAEMARYKRMFEAACVALGEISDALGIDPNEGGAEPILDAIAELKAAQPSQAGELTPQEIYDIAHRKASRYTCTAPVIGVMYGFSESHLLDFVEAINAKAVQLSQEDAQDAARYRWLRSTTNWASNSNNERIDVRNSPELWDSAIDAAITAKNAIDAAISAKGAAS